MECRLRNAGDSELRRWARIGASLPLLCLPLMPALGQNLNWTDIDCARSPLAVNDGFRCRATDAYSPGGGSRASYKFYTATATTDEGMTYLYLMEGLDQQSWIRLSSALPEQLSQSIPAARTGRDWSEVRLHAGSGYALFTAESGESCVGFRKAGPARGSGHAWAILGVHCAPKGQALSDTGIVNTIEAAHVK